MSDPPGPPSRDRTTRQQLAEALRQGPQDARELSSRVSVSQKDVGRHLEHLRRSLAKTPEQLKVEPSRCLGCGFAFDERKRMSRPSRCPRCKGERLQPPRFWIDTR